MQKHVRTSGRSKNVTRSARRSFVTGVCLKRLFRGSTNHPARRCNPARLEFVVCVSTSPFSGDRALGGSPETALANAFGRTDEIQHGIYERLGVFFGDPMGGSRQASAGYILGDLPHHFFDERPGRTGGAADGEYGDRQPSLRFQSRTVILCVLIEGAVELEAGTHRARSCRGGHVGLEVVFADRGGIENPRVEEDLEILPLASRDEYLRDVARTVECEVPDSRVCTQAIEDRRARQRRISDYEMRDLVLMSPDAGIGDHQPDVMADQHDGSLNLEVLPEQSMDVLCHRLLVVATRWPPRMPGTPIVGRDHPKVVCDEGWDDAAPLPPSLREAVQEHDRARSFPCGDVMETQARLNLGHPVCGAR